MAERPFPTPSSDDEAQSIGEGSLDGVPLTEDEASWHSDRDEGKKVAFDAFLGRRTGEEAAWEGKVEMGEDRGSRRVATSRQGRRAAGLLVGLWGDWLLHENTTLYSINIMTRHSIVVQCYKLASDDTSSVLTAAQF